MGASTVPDDAVCQVCGEKCRALDKVHCLSCSTPHHRDCWMFVGHCSTFACGSRLRTEAGASPPEGSLVEVDARSRGQLDGAPIRRTTFPIKDVDGYLLPLDSARTRLDLDTPIEQLLQWGSLAVALLATVFMENEHGPPRPELVRLCFALAWLVFLPRLFTTCAYALDNDRRRLLYVRRFLGLSFEYDLGDFDQVRGAGLIGRNRRSRYRDWWEYSVALQLPDGVTVEVSPYTPNLPRADGYAEGLARHLETELIPSTRENSNLGSAGGWVLWGKLPAVRWDGLTTVLGSMRLRWFLWWILVTILNLLVWFPFG